MEYAQEKDQRSRSSRGTSQAHSCSQRKEHHNDRRPFSLEKKKGTTAEDFRNFIIDLLPKIPRSSLIVLDNAKIHHAENIEGVWTPYSPFLNPIEYAFSVIQSAVQSVEWWTRGELISVVEDKVQTAVTSEKAEAFYMRSFVGKPLDPDVLEQRTTQTPSSRLQITELNFMHFVRFTP